ncbi:MAG TPA: glycoside hydrolase family 3 N-terminal domain-containing protein, partial [Streptosporangiaceae bacterium]
AARRSDGQPADAGQSSAAGHPAVSGTASRPAAASPDALPALTPAQMAGQRVIYSYTGLEPPAALLNWIRHGQVGGVIFFGANISSRAQIASVISELDQANASPLNPMRGVPLLLMTDQEGGLVRRLPGQPLLSEKQIGEAADPAAAARAAGTGAGKNLAGVGMNVNLAPVLDVYRHPGDFDDQFGRSYSTDAHVVSSLGAGFIAAQQAAGVAAAAKHFPGLGAATKAQNTDEAPVTLNVTLHALRTVDEFPYRAAIAAGVKLVMVSWARYSALAPKTPAGLSSAIVNGELRQRLGFKGVTITDALEAGALRSFGTTRRRATLAARAGMDLILCSAQRPSQGQQARIALANGLSAGTLSPSVFNAALTRVAALRSSLGN